MYAALWKATAALAAGVLAVGLVALATAPSDGAAPTCRVLVATDADMDDCPGAPRETTP